MRKLDKAMVGDDLVGAPEFIRLPRGVRLLLIEMTTWSANRHSEGVVPSHVLPRLTDEPQPEVAAGHLVTAGFLSVDEEDNFRIDWRGQLTADEVTAYDEKNRRNAARVRRCKAGDHSECRNCWFLRQHRGDPGYVPSVRTPPVPDTRNVPFRSVPTGQERELGTDAARGADSPGAVGDAAGPGEKKLCPATTQAGEACSKYPIKGKRFCVNHQRREQAEAKTEEARARREERAAALPELACPECAFTTKSGGALASHARLHAPPVQCPDCEWETKANNARSLLRDHGASVHPTCARVGCGVPVERRGQCCDPHEAEAGASRERDRQLRAAGRRPIR